MIIFRLLPAIFLGDGIYGDEQDEFECVGTQPGCRNMCFTEFSPMQPPRMWCLQILLSCVPPVIFNFYAARQTAQYHRDMELMTSYEEKLGKMDEDEISGDKILTDQQVEMLHAEDERNYHTSRDENPYRQYQKITNRLKKFKKKQMNTYDVQETRAEVIWSPSIRIGYLIHLIVKLGFEFIFFYTVYWYQTRQTKRSGFTEVWFVPRYYICTLGSRSDLEYNACTQDKTVTCWNTRPQEKLWYIIYNVAMQCLSIFIIVLDIVFVSSKQAKKHRRNKKQREFALIRNQGLLTTPSRPTTRNTDNTEHYHRNNLNTSRSRSMRSMDKLHK